MMRRLMVLMMLTAGLASGCGDDGATSEEEPNGDLPELTYYADAKAIIDARCATCHSPGNIGPFPLTTFEEVAAFSIPVRNSIESGTMPPWQPDDDCNTYTGSIDLTAPEKDTLLGWLNGGAVAGDPADAPDINIDPAPAFVGDISLQLPEPYTPQLEPDDHRCQLIPWPADETRFVTGLQVTPDQRAIVHHVIVFVVGPDEVEQFQAYDDAEEGPGYTCYGGPRGVDAGSGLGGADLSSVAAALTEMGLTFADLQAGNLTDAQFSELMGKVGGGSMGGFPQVGSWVPGAATPLYPAGTGIRVEPGSLLVAQFHYNTISSDPVADQSTIEIQTAPSVEREATLLRLTDVGWVSNGLVGDPMTIPAGAESVAHSLTASYDSFLLNAARRALGLADDAPLVIHQAGHHMHELGTSQRTELRHADGSTTCVLDTPDWDFAWQGDYTFAEPITIRPGDSIQMGCTWNNTEANQPIIDGEVRQPVDVEWGEGTADEMCLGGFYVTSE